ncbi:TPA: hypothetical protein DCW54_00420 [Candidatus Dependentiae bacterium]|nr:hypothetical protein [Candidatus Dependentiae bacterium]
MRKSLIFSSILTTSLTIFAMLFGAGNLIFPLRLGVDCQGNILPVFLGFTTTGILLPVLGLIGIVLFDGNYTAFFGRLGNIWGQLLILLCMIIIGPGVVMPRITGFVYEMTRPFLFGTPLWGFVIGFSLIVFLATYRLNRVLDIIGKFLSPAKLTSIIGLITVGAAVGGTLVKEPINTTQLFLTAFKGGYMTLDLLGTIFFGAIIVKLLANYGEASINRHKAAIITGLSGVIAGIILGIVYLGITLLGAWHGRGLELLNPGEIFNIIAFRILGNWGAAAVALIIALAGLTTLVSLTLVVSDYLQRMLKGRLSFQAIVLLVLVFSGILASFGLGEILIKSEPVILLLYPLIIAVTICNILYKLIGFTWIKTPVLLTGIATVWFMFFSGI